MRAFKGSWPVIDLFSGAGGMSFGFAQRHPFHVLAAVDAEHAKPSDRIGTLDCNDTYAANIGIRPLAADLAKLTPSELLAHVHRTQAVSLAQGDLTVLLCCPPCTDFSRAKPTNHSVDTAKNSLVVRTADFIEALRPEFLVMENARELIQGNHAHHYRALETRLRRLGYDVRGDVYMLTNFGLPQVRERAIVVASRVSEARTLSDLWAGRRVLPHALTVRTALARLNRPPVAPGASTPTDAMHQAPGFGSELVRRRMAAIPPDGGSWFDLAGLHDADVLLIDSMKRRLAANDLGSHPDVYGRLAWDRPAVTIKRECAHVGNGRYSHPVETRLLTVREMAYLQGFPDNYQFRSSSLANNYRHVGDAVPPLISYQLAAIVHWMKTGVRPEPADWILPGTVLREEDLILDCATSRVTNAPTARTMMPALI